MKVKKAKALVDRVKQSIQLGQKALILVVLLFCMLPKASAEDSLTLTIFVDKSYPPYMYETQATMADGLYPRLLYEAARRTGYIADVRAYPWKRALLHAASGKGAVGGAYLNDKRVKVYDYSAPLYQEKLVVFVNKDRPFNFESIDDLQGKLVGVNRGWSYGQAFDEARASELFKVNIRNNPEDNFKMLALGRIDCLILDQMSGESYTGLLGISDQISVLPKAFSVNNGYLIIPKKLEMRAFLDRFNLSLSAMREDGTYERIVRTFINTTLSH